MLDDLHDRVGRRIASLLRAEAAMVTSGAASALTLGTAAVLTGTDRQKIIDLPDLTRMKSEVIVQKSHRFAYDHAVRNCGIRFVEVETRDDLERAVTDRTAMMLFYNNNNTVGQIRDEEFVELGRKHGIPTFNDAAADVPPVENLWKYTAMGFDLALEPRGGGVCAPCGPDRAGDSTPGRRVPLPDPVLEPPSARGSPSSANTARSAASNRRPVDMTSRRQAEESENISGEASVSRKDLRSRVCR